MHLSIVLHLVELAAGVIIPCAVISTVFKTRLLRALQAWFPTLLANITTVAIALLVVRPFLYEAFVLPTNAMAPTLVGRHWRGMCPVCGAPALLFPHQTRNMAHSLQLRMICDRFHVTDASDLDTTVYASDLFLVAKFLTPRRWDLVVFQYPGDPSTHVRQASGRFSRREDPSFKTDPYGLMVNGKRRRMPFRELNTCQNFPIRSGSTCGVRPIAPPCLARTNTSCSAIFPQHRKILDCGNRAHLDTIRTQFLHRT